MMSDHPPDRRIHTVIVSIQIGRRGDEVVGAGQQIRFLVVHLVHKAGDRHHANHSRSREALSPGD